MMVKQTTMLVTGWVLVVLFVKNYLMKQTLQKNMWSNTTVMKRTGVLRMMRTKICIPALFVPLILTTLSMQDLTNNSCWRRLLFESVLFEKIVLSHNSIYKLKPLWLWMRNWNSLPSSSLNSIWPGLFWCIRDPLTFETLVCQRGVWPVCKGPPLWNFGISDIHFFSSKTR